MDGPDNPAHPPEHSSGRSTNNNRRNRQRPRDANNNAGPGSQRPRDQQPRTPQDGMGQRSRGGGRRPPRSDGQSMKNDQPQPSTENPRRRGAKFNTGLTPADSIGPTHSRNDFRARHEPVADDLTSRLTAALATYPYPDCPICFNAVHPAQPSWSCSPSIGVLDAPQYCWTTFHLKCMLGQLVGRAEEMVNGVVPDVKLVEQPCRVVIVVSVTLRLHPRQPESRLLIRVLPLVLGSAQIATTLAHFFAILVLVHLAVLRPSSNVAVRVAKFSPFVVAKLIFPVALFAVELSIAAFTSVHVTAMPTLALLVPNVPPHAAIAAKKIRKTFVELESLSIARSLGVILGQVLSLAHPLAIVRLRVESIIAISFVILKTALPRLVLVIQYQSQPVRVVAFPSAEPRTLLSLPDAAAPTRSQPVLRPATRFFLAATRVLPAVTKAIVLHAPKRLSIPVAVVLLPRRFYVRQLMRHHWPKQRSSVTNPVQPFVPAVVIVAFKAKGKKRATAHETESPVGEEPGGLHECDLVCGKMLGCGLHLSKSSSVHAVSLCLNHPFPVGRLSNALIHVLDLPLHVVIQERLTAVILTLLLVLLARSSQPKALAVVLFVERCSPVVLIPVTKFVMHQREKEKVADHVQHHVGNLGGCVIQPNILAPLLAMLPLLATKLSHALLSSPSRAHACDGGSSKSSITAESREKLGEVVWNDETRAFGRANQRFVGLMEKAFADFVASEKKTQVLPHMPPERRKFVHDVASVYRMDTQMVDQEPHRSVQLIRRYDTKLPTPLLSSIVGTATAAHAGAGGLGKLADLRGAGGSWRTPPAAIPKPEIKPATTTQRGWGVPVTPTTPTPVPPIAPSSRPPGISVQAHVVAPPPQTPTAVPEDWEDED
ncbi:R3H domain-containing protein [Mycena indigotica]|uniref:R3H domain-containing protein n=1 Tax=Mycena indigotica TaxID=2126181 RepID=A0A8H6S0Q2_9AGAR|nr:R3H domain-containing protein [Mycena indigotica]KAF7289901.1 R3H domain-containing protein [Mycena indigotica]